MSILRVHQKPDYMMRMSHVNRGKPGFLWCANFDGVNDYMEYNRGGGQSMIYENGDHAFEFYIKDTNSLTGNIIFKNPLGGATSITRLYITNPNVFIVYRVPVAAGLEEMSISYDFGTQTQAQWRHVIVSYKASTQTMSLFVDGQLVGTDTHATAINTTPLNADMRIGPSLGAKLDELRIYTREILAAEALDNYNNGVIGVPSNTSNLIMRWPFERNLNNVASWGGAATDHNFAVDIYQLV